MIEVPTELKVPEGYDVVSGPFTLPCSGQSIDITFNLPDEYKNLKLLRCKDGQCYEIIGMSNLENLTCGNESIHDSIERKLSERESYERIPEVFELQPPAKGLITEGQRVLISGRAKLEFTGWIPPYLLVTISTLNTSIAEPLNPSLGIVNVPQVITLEKAIQGKIPARIIFPYSETRKFESDTIQLFYYKNNEWNLIDGKNNPNEKSIEVTTDDLTQFEENNKIILAPLGVICYGCIEAFKQGYNYSGLHLKKVYDYGKSKDAFILIHGLMSSPRTFEFIVNDFKYNKQPAQIWTLEYSTGRDLDVIAQEFIDTLELHLDEYDHIYLIGHSLGSFVIQEGLLRANEAKKKDPLKYGFLDRVKNVVLIAGPHEGSPGVEVYRNMFKNLVNEKTSTQLFNMNSALLKKLSEGLLVQKMPNIQYYVIAGSRTYEFNLGIFKVKSEELLGIQGKNDGITTIKGAQRVGESYINNSCKDFFGIDLTHTELVTNPTALRVLERIMNQQRAEEKSDNAVLGYNQYFQSFIQSCTADEYFMIVGQRIEEEATYDPLNCKCGNGVCGVGENELNCPIDCATPTRLPGICLIAPVTLNFFSIIVILVFIAYLIEKYFIVYHREHHGRKLQYTTYVLLLLLAIASVWTRMVCKKTVPYAYLILLVGALYVIFIEVRELLSSNKKQTRETSLKIPRFAFAIPKAHLPPRAKSSLEKLDSALKHRRHHWLRIFTHQKRQKPKVQDPELRKIDEMLKRMKDKRE
ncbi:hypothetical protein J4457_03090 [Candidatus Woesearchaeota archaeon]|nr:hypothetical protein [Candidatus Woesearchaeota archaeon]